MLDQNIYREMMNEMRYEDHAIREVFSPGATTDRNHAHWIPDDYDDLPAIAFAGWLELVGWGRFDPGYAPIKLDDKNAEDLWQRRLAKWKIKQGIS